LYSYQDMHNGTLYNAIQSGAKRIEVGLQLDQSSEGVANPDDLDCHAGVGGVSTSFNYAVEDVLNNYNVPVVQSMRINSGEVPLRDVSSQTAIHIASGYLDPEKSRILLGLLLAEGKND
jgi:L-asparaginase